MDVAKRIGQIRTLEAKIKDIKATQIKPLDELAEQLRNSVIAYLQSTNQLNAKTSEGTAYLSRRVSYSLEDPDSFRRHVIGTEQWELADWKANKTAMDDLVLKKEALPPGVIRNSEVVLGVNAPPKPRTKTPVKPNGGLTKEEWDKVEAEVDQEQPTL